MQAKQGTRSSGDTLPSHVALLDRHGVISAVNRPWGDFARRSWLRLPDPCVGANYLEICEGVRGRHAADARAVAAAIRDAIGGGSRKFTFEYPGEGPGHEAWFELRVVAFERSHGGEEDVAVLVTHHDITDARLTERRLEESLGQVRRLASHLQDAREQERRLIAREIHDELGHQLTALKIDVVGLERELQRVSSGLASRAASMKTLFDRVIASVRRLSSELRPGLLDDFGLVAAIEWQAEVFEEHTGIATELAIEADETGLSAPLSTATFRILQESLTNVARHSRADRVRIALRREQQHLLLEVRDNGRGFEERQLRDPMSHGITGMRERALALDGAFRIEGRPGDGTTVTARLPIEVAAGGEASSSIPTHALSSAAS